MKYYSILGNVCDTAVYLLWGNVVPHLSNILFMKADIFLITFQII